MGNTIDDLIRQESAVKDTDEQPEYALVATTAWGKVVYGQPPMWGRYVLTPPQELFEDKEPEIRPVTETSRPMIVLTLNPGYGW